MRILITGGTGFIGKRVIHNLYPIAEKIYLLVRPQSHEKAKRIFKAHPKIKIVLGDITENDILYDIDHYFEIVHTVDTILNLAGCYDLKITELDSYTHNVIGVQNMINFAKNIQTLEFFHHVSSYAVTGSLEGSLSEDEMEDALNFTDHYARSKMQGEAIFRKADLGKVKKRNYRPGIVVGSIENGEIEKVDGPYYLLRFIYENQNLLRKLDYLNFFPLPYNKKAILPIVPVDIYADWQCQAVLNPNPEEELISYNMIGEKKVYLKDFVRLLFKAYGIKLKLIRIKRVKMLKKLLPLFGMPEELLQYMYGGANYNLDHKKRDFPDMAEYDLRDLAPNLIKGSEKYFEGIL